MRPESDATRVGPSIVAHTHDLDPFAMTDKILRGALGEPAPVIAYSLGAQIRALYPDAHILETDSFEFDFEAFTAAEHCTLVPRDGIHTPVVTEWRAGGRPFASRIDNGWLYCKWEGQSLALLRATWNNGGCQTSHCWIVAERRETAERFFRCVCEWNSELRDEVLVFDGGSFHKSTELFRAIRSATFENLVLEPAFERAVREDFARFFGARETYERYRIPWKRGVLFLGPPGNGKTHTIKALIHTLAKPCVYVKSIRAKYRTPQDCLRTVYDRARKSAPCIVVLEDLDTIVDAKSLSFFLNELDGFASNTGVVTLATTNHPERLDPALLDRPSRFDRKFEFPLPALPERVRYLARWNEGLEPATRLSARGLDRIGERTQGFSFAYLKELAISSLMAWIAKATPGSMDDVMSGQATVLREQMKTSRAWLSAPAPATAESDGDDD